MIQFILVNNVDLILGLNLYVCSITLTILKNFYTNSESFDISTKEDDLNPTSNNGKRHDSHIIFINFYGGFHSLKSKNACKMVKRLYNYLLFYFFVSAYSLVFHF